MQFPQVLLLAFAAAASAAKFKFFDDQSCQAYDKSYITVTSAQLKDLVIQSWPTTAASSWDSNLFLDKEKCPRPSDNTVKWVRYMIPVSQHPSASLQFESVREKLT